MDTRGPGRRVLILNSTDATTSSGHLMHALADAFARYGDASTEVRHLGTGGSRWRKLRTQLPSLRRLKAAWQADVVVVHTSVIFAAQEILLARLLGKQVRAIYWDAYPEGFAAAGQRPGPLLVPYGWLERGLLRLCHAILPPSTDYLPRLEEHGLESRARIFPMWPFTPVLPVAPTRPGIADGARPLEICFAGALNAIRGIDTALQRILAASTGPVELHSYGRTAPEVPAHLAAEMADGRLTIRHHGYVPQDEIMARLATHDLGLVALSPRYAQPAFPSKTVSYVCAGLPVLYHGPSLPALSGFLVRTGTGVVLDDNLDDLHAAAGRVRANMGEAQVRALAELRLDETRIAEIL